MFTKNWYKAVYSLIANKGGFTYKNLSGAVKINDAPSASFLELAGTGGYSCSPNMRYVRTAFTSAGGVFFGTGTTPPTINDVALSGNVVSGFSYMTDLSTQDTDDGFVIQADYTITNTSDKTITIGEIGIIAQIAAGSTNSSWSVEAYKALLERTVLEIPVTIEPGGVGQITYTVRMNGPAA